MALETLSDGKTYIYLRPGECLAHELNHISLFLIGRPNKAAFQIYSNFPHIQKIKIAIYTP